MIKQRGTRIHSTAKLGHFGNPPPPHGGFLRSRLKGRVCRSIGTCHQLAVCCSVWQCVAVCCSVLQCAYMSPTCSVLQCVAVCCRVVATCCRVLQRVAECCSVSCAVTNSITNSFSPLHTSHGACDGCFLVHACALVPYHDLGLLQCVAVCCSVLQCVAVRCRVLQCYA